MCNFTPTTLADAPPDDTRTVQVANVTVTADARGYAVSLFPYDCGGDVPAGVDPLEHAGAIAAQTLRDLAREIEEACRA
jgi:hypothetical protein